MPFRSIVGHRRVVSLLSRAVARGTLPPALLLAGPAGVGKRRTAIALAEAINCLKVGPPEGGPYADVTSPGGGPYADVASPEGGLKVGPPESGRYTDVEPARTVLELDACGECSACRRIARGVHPDVLLIEPGDTGTIKIEQVRDVIDRAGYRPFEGRRRAVIIDEADALVVPAQNALLKTLEEPPSASIFVLVSSLPDALLPTVRSRCPRLRFGPLSPGEVASVLVRDHGYADVDARAAAADAEGSVGRALAAQAADLAEARASAHQLLEQAARVTDPTRRLALARDLTPSAKGTPASERDQLAACLRALSSLLRDLGFLASRADRRMLANADLAAPLETLSRSYDSDRSMKAYVAVDQALAALERNASPKIVADWLVLQL